MKSSIKIGIIGDYDPARPAHIATDAALDHAAELLQLELEKQWLATDSLEKAILEKRLNEFDGLFCSPGSPYRSLDGALAAITYARESNKPFFGT